MSNRAGNKLFRLVFIAVLGAAAIAIVINLKSPLAVSESDVRRMIQKHELVGLTLDAAADMLQHETPATTDGIVVCDFKQVKGWRSGPVCLDVKDGKVVAATWMPADGVVEESGDGNVR